MPWYIIPKKLRCVYKILIRREFVCYGKIRFVSLPNNCARTSWPEIWQRSTWLPSPIGTTTASNPHPSLWIDGWYYNFGYNAASDNAKDSYLGNWTNCFSHWNTFLWMSLDIRTTITSYIEVFLCRVSINWSWLFVFELIFFFFFLFPESDNCFYVGSNHMEGSGHNRRRGN